MPAFTGAQPLQIPVKYTSALTCQSILNPKPASRCKCSTWRTPSSRTTSTQPRFLPSLRYGLTCSCPSSIPHPLRCPPNTCPHCAQTAAAIRDGRALTDQRTLIPGVGVCYANLKKYTYRYWFAFPVLRPLENAKGHVGDVGLQAAEVRLPSACLPLHLSTE